MCDLGDGTRVPAGTARRLACDASVVEVVKDAKGNVHEGAFDKVPDDARNVLKETGEKAGKALTQRIRKMDEDAFKRLSGKMKAFQNADDGARLEWARLFYLTRQKLRGTEISAQTFDEIMKFADLANEEIPKLKAAGKI